MNSTEEVATKLVDYCRKGEWRKALDDLYAQDIVSVEAREMENMPIVRMMPAIPGSVRTKLNIAIAPKSSTRFRINAILATRPANR